MENQEPQIIGEGAYGCVIKPGIDSQGNPDTVPGYISKIEIEKSTIDNEINVSNKIKQIPDYEDRFSPILENAPLELGKINVKEINDCKIVQQLSGSDNIKLEINKIKYVGKDSLEMYLLNILEENPEKFVEMLINTHIYLLDSLTELNKVGIIHNDIKENNILCRDDTGVPIMIDFGLSIESEYLRLPDPPSIIGSLTQEKKGSHIYKYFFKYEPSYEVWCIEIHILNYMLTELNREWLQSPVTQEQINYLLSLTKDDADRFSSSVDFSEGKIYGESRKRSDGKAINTFPSSYLNKLWFETILDLNRKGNNNLLEIIYESYGYQWRTKKTSGLETIVNAYIENNLMKSKLFNKEELEECRANLLAFVSSYNDKNWEELFNDLISSQYMFDNYALSIVYLKIIVSFGITQSPQQALLAPGLVVGGFQPPDQTGKIKEYGQKTDGLQQLTSLPVDFNKQSLFPSTGNLGFTTLHSVKPTKVALPLEKLRELLKEIILSKPKERKTAEETKQAIKEVLQKVPKSIFSKMIDIVMGRKENHSNIKQSVVTKKIDELNREGVLYETKKLF